MRQREILKIGGSLHIRLSISDLIDLKLKEGDHVDIDDLVKVE